MKATAKTAAAVTAAAMMGAGAAARAVPVVYDVTMAQVPNTRLVEVTYKLTNANAIVTLSIETNGVAIPDSAVTRLSGDVCKVIAAAEGVTNTITWNAGADWPEHEVDNAKARVTAWSVDAPPQVMVIDLSKGTAASWPENPYPCYYYTSLDALPGGVTNSVYKSTQLALRKICMNSMAPYGVFTMGEGTGVKQVTLTQDFYIGVYEVTQGQWFNVMGGPLPANFTDASSRAFRPMERVSYNDIRGSSDGAGWPANNAVDAGTFIGNLRVKTGNVNGFDLPTEAQWEYACRAGTTTCFNDGDGDANVSGDNANTNVWLDALGRYKFNGGYIDGVTPPPTDCGPANGTAIVGSYVPNAWGLYDTHGNEGEWCLDWYTSGLAGGEDPVGPEGAGLQYRVIRGSDWSHAASFCRSAARSFNTPSYSGSFIGLRVAAAVSFIE
ncbi:MAG: formylglycine-generating enzyme family protein [Kiritimatiellae bacterium]|nr:formylglycine-generating enzyme family protein [Kiritimatiellia bacterium]